VKFSQEVSWTWLACTFRLRGLSTGLCRHYEQQRTLDGSLSCKECLLAWSPKLHGHLLIVFTLNDG
jgi:hypothetical protein